MSAEARGDATLEALKRRIVSIFPTQVRTCIESLSDEQIWWRPNQTSNSVGNLVVHLSGSLKHNLSRAFGGFEYDRDRPAEFAERGPLSKSELMALFDEAIRQASVTLDSFDTARFLDPTDEPDFTPTAVDRIIGVCAHLALHTGQIVYVTKMLQEGSIDEMWIVAHRNK